MFEIKIFVAQSLLSKHETGQSSVFNHFIETKLLERFHSSNLVVNHPVGRKPASVCPVVDSQCVPEDQEMSRRTSKWFMALPLAVHTGWLYNNL